METPQLATPRLWDRARRAAQAQIVETAMRLFDEYGFDATTIEQITEASGISRRSFFRYFGTKEDIVFGDLAELGQRLRSALEARPADETPWVALRATFSTLVSRDSSPEDMLRVNRLLLGSPALRARHLEKHLRWQRLLAPEIERRLGIVSGPIPDPRAWAIVAAALACLDTASEIWTLRGGTDDPAAIYDEAVAAVRQ